MLGSGPKTLASVYQLVYSTHMQSFGSYIRERREALRTEDRAYSVRQVAQRMGVQPSYLSKVERDEVSPPSEETTRKLAHELGMDADVLLALAGKVSSDLQDVIRKRPALFAELIRSLKETPDSAVIRLVREVRDGEW
jgi:HTH-type transcriptional regulator, competence development regulator